MVCLFGDDVEMELYTPAYRAKDGIAKWEQKSVDCCLAKLIHGLNTAGFTTVSSQCGHCEGNDRGYIELLGGRVLEVHEDKAKFFRARRS